MTDSDFVRTGHRIESPERDEKPGADWLLLCHFHRVTIRRRSPGFADSSILRLLQMRHSIQSEDSKEPDRNKRYPRLH